MASLTMAEELAEASPPAAEASRPTSTFFSANLGVKDFEWAKTSRSLCVLCSPPTAIEKGTLRYVFAVAEKRPPKWIHHGCCSKMDPSLYAKSIENLKKARDNLVINSFVLDQAAYDTITASVLALESLAAHWRNKGLKLQILHHVLLLTF